MIGHPQVQGQQTNETVETQARRSKFKEIFDQIAPLKIYGKVVDTTGAPIEGADVSVGWENADSLLGERDSGGQELIKTDANGCWTFTINKPFRVFVENAGKAGYEYSSANNSDGSGRNLVEKKTTRDTPVVTVLRKKGETTFLIRREERQLIRVIAPHSQTNSLDILLKKGERAPVSRYEDIRVAANYQKATGRWEVAFAATNGTDGLMFGTNWLYEIPLDGYQHQVVLDGPPWPPYLYLRSRTPAIYSCIFLDHDNFRPSFTNQGYRINCEMWVNPYGERNLEYETDLNKEWRLADQLEDDAKKSLHQHKHPVKPDLQNLIKDAKDKRKAGG